LQVPGQFFSSEDGRSFVVGTPPIADSPQKELHAARQFDKTNPLIFQQGVPQIALMDQSLYIYRNGQNDLAKAI
jgi:hypothetical protein